MQLLWAAVLPEVTLLSKIGTAKFKLDNGSQRMKTCSIKSALCFVDEARICSVAQFAPLTLQWQTNVSEWVCCHRWYVVNVQTAVDSEWLHNPPNRCPIKKQMYRSGQCFTSGLLLLPNLLLKKSSSVQIAQLKVNNEQMHRSGSLLLLNVWKK